MWPSGVCKRGQDSSALLDSMSITWFPEKWRGLDLMSQVVPFSPDKSCKDTLFICFSLWEQNFQNDSHSEQLLGESQQSSWKAVA